MVKIVSVFKFRDDVPREECLQHYLEEHPKVVRDVLPDARRYVQGVPLKYRSEDFVWDGVTEISFDDVDSFKRAFKSDRISELREDEQRFVKEITWVMVEEHVQF